MRKPVYRHPDFVSNASAKQIESENKRLWLTLTIDKDLKESVVIILKIPAERQKIFLTKQFITLQAGFIKTETDSDN